jgi:circadian clock protein KaiC
MEQSAFIATGVPRLDLILGGGIVRNSLFLIAGLPGSGKTVLATQIAFAAAERGDRVLFVTAFSEPHNKLISNLRTFSFFDQSKIGDTIKLLNLQHQLTSSINEAGETIVREVRSHRANLVVLDGFQSIGATSETILAPHQFLYDLNAKLSLLNVSSIVTYNHSSNLDETRPELTAVDGIIVLSQEIAGDRVTRVMQVVKHRGASQLLGKHSFLIANTGISCYPRQETLLVNMDSSVDTVRASSGIAALDTMLGGGINRGTNAIIAGAEGSGKTLLGLYFVMQGIDQGEPAIFVTLHETAQQLTAKAQAFGFDLDGAVRAGKLHIHHHVSAELNPDIVMQHLRETLAELGPCRVVIDGLHELEVELAPSQRMPSFFTAFTRLLHSQKATAYFLLEVDPLVGKELSFGGTAFSALADNVLLMQRSEVNSRLVHTLVVLKMRFAQPDRAFHVYTTDNNTFSISLNDARPKRTKRGGRF